MQREQFKLWRAEHGTARTIHVARFTSLPLPQLNTLRDDCPMMRQCEYTQLLSLPTPSSEPFLAHPCTDLHHDSACEPLVFSKHLRPCRNEGHLYQHPCPKNHLVSDNIWQQHVLKCYSSTSSLKVATSPGIRDVRVDRQDQPTLLHLLNAFSKTSALPCNATSVSCLALCLVVESCR